MPARTCRLGIAVLNFHPGILEIGLTDTLLSADLTPGTHEAMVADWFRTQIAEQRSVGAEESAAQLSLSPALAATDYTLGLLSP